MKKKKALVTDWYYTNGGAEKVNQAINEIWDNFDHFALVDFLDKDDRATILKGAKVKTSFIQNLPFVKKNHRIYLQFFPFAIEQFDLMDYDIVISSSSSIAKGVLTNNNQIHFCYCHSPARYAWDLYHSSLKEAGISSGIKSIYAKYVLHKFRIWDCSSINRVDYYIANSQNVANRIKKTYGKDSVVIYPPVDVDFFELKTQKKDFYFAASRLVPYKKLELIVETFNSLPEQKLKVAGEGPLLNKLKKIANSNIEILGYVSKEELRVNLQDAKAFIFASEEDFGIIPVEAQACGTPVIAFGKGGALETIIDGETGVFFEEQTIQSLTIAINYFEKLSFDFEKIHIHAKKFSKQNFEMKFKNFIELNSTIEK